MYFCAKFVNIAKRYFIKVGAMNDFPPLPASGFSRQGSIGLWHRMTFLPPSKRLILRIDIYHQQFYKTGYTT